MVREIGPGELLAATSHPFVRHQVDPARVTRAWQLGDALVVDGARGRPGETVRGTVYTCLGPPGDLTPLMAYVDEAGAAPWRVSVEQPAVLPPAWHRPASHEWHWMLTTRPARRRVSRGVEVLTAADAAAVDELLDAANPHSFARPGVPGVAAWLGIRDGERLLAAGALQRMHDGTLHLRGVGVRPEARGRGLGTALSAALTDHALLHGSGVATLGVYSDNAAALAVYSRLGYRVAVTFTSGEVGVRT